MAERRTRWLALNDSRLASFFEAAGEAERDEEFARLLAGVVRPTVRGALARYVRAERLQPHDCDDVAAHVELALLRKLRAALVLEEENVQNVEAYAVTLTQNAVHDLLRKRAPERARLRNRLRYLFLRDPRLALWNISDEAICGLKEWQGREPASAPRAAGYPRAAYDSARPADAVAALIAHLRAPMRFADLVRLVAELWQIRDDPPLEDSGAVVPPHDAAVDSRQFLRILWSEIAGLPPRQSAALLLNLREPGGGNALLLLVAHGIARFGEIAAALDLSEQTLAEIWDDLPLDDLTIASRLGVTRQQVINLRKSARDRLSRRMAARSAGPHQ